MRCRKWEVWYARFKFEDSNDIKNRPVIITGVGDAYILSVKVTTHEPRKGYEGEYRIKYWKEAGLRNESTARLSKRLKLIDSDLIHKIGDLHPVDIIEIQRRILRSS